MRLLTLPKVLDNDADNTITPHSPPPSFRSRASSLTRTTNNEVNATLADAFDADGSDDEDNDGDDRQRLMRGGSVAARPNDDVAEEGAGYIIGSDGTRRPPPAIQRQNTSLPSFVPVQSGRVYGAGNQADGVFANLNAKPEAGEKLEEHPPVCSIALVLQTLTDSIRHTSKQQQMQPHHTGRQRYLHQAWADRTTST